MSKSQMQTRRAFLKSGLLGGAMTWTLPTFLHSTMQWLTDEALAAPLRKVTGKDGPILVVLQMAGGNDGLNTVVPYTNDFYYRARPTIGIPKDDCLKLNDTFGIHPELSGFKNLYEQGLLSVVQGVGYPNPNRSHFRSMEIWHTASDSERVENLGWLGKYFDCCCSGSDPGVGISLGQEAPQAFTAKAPKGLVFKDVDKYRYFGDEDYLRRVSGDLMDDEVTGASIPDLSGRRRKPVKSPLEFLERTSLDAQVSSDEVRSVAKETLNVADYPNSRLGQDLALVARLIGGGMSTRVYYLSQGGYDTHNQQSGSHAQLMGELGNSVNAFMEDMKAQGQQDRVLLMTFSEFGRRVKQNGSAGTDHGTASPMFLMGGGTKGGIFGDMPSLDPTQLDKGDLRHTVDFRSVYATVLEQWLGVSSTPVLGRPFRTLPLLKG